MPQLSKKYLLNASVARSMTVDATVWHLRSAALWRRDNGGNLLACQPAMEVDSGHFDIVEIALGLEDMDHAAHAGRTKGFRLGNRLKSAADLSGKLLKELPEKYCPLTGLGFAARSLHGAFELQELRIQIPGTSSAAPSTAIYPRPPRFTASAMHRDDGPLIALNLRDSQGG